MRIFLPEVLTIDPSIGRIDKSVLSQQTLMELFIEHVANKGIIYGRNGPIDISEWPDITFNDTMEITEIDWSYLDINGSIALEWLPFTLEKLTIIRDSFSDGWLTGTIDLTSLPESLICLELSGDTLEGTISLTALPNRMEVLNLSKNKLTGNLDFTNLPPGLKTLKLSWNDFFGVTDFSKLPNTLKELDIEKTDLEGTIFVDSNRMTFRYDVNGTNVKIVNVK